MGLKFLYNPVFFHLFPSVSFVLPQLTGLLTVLRWCPGTLLPGVFTGASGNALPLNSHVAHSEPPSGLCSVRPAILNTAASLPCLRSLPLNTAFFCLPCLFFPRPCPLQHNSPCNLCFVLYIPGTQNST